MLIWKERCSLWLEEGFPWSPQELISTVLDGKISAKTDSGDIGCPSTQVAVQPIFHQSSTVYITVDVFCWRREIRKSYKRNTHWFCSKQIHTTETSRKTGCSVSAKSFARSSLSSSPSFSSAVAWFGKMTKKTWGFNSSQFQVTLCQWRETWSDISRFFTLLLANFLLVASFLQIVAMVGLSNIPLIAAIISFIFSLNHGQASSSGESLPPPPFLPRPHHRPDLRHQGARHSGSIVSTRDAMISYLTQFRHLLIFMDYWWYLIFQTHCDALDMQPILCLHFTTHINWFSPQPSPPAPVLPLFGDVFVIGDGQN